VKAKNIRDSLHCHDLHGPTAAGRKESRHLHSIRPWSFSSGLAPTGRRAADNLNIDAGYEAAEQMNAGC